ncbi:MAG: hypothetical protein KDA37_16495, partial [Planctomycetales bacterium]|nr:hypothetical protein [Planctomycetales bacterium]
MKRKGRFLPVLVLVHIAWICPHHAGGAVYPDPNATGRDGFNDGLYMLIRDDVAPAPSQATIDSYVAQGVEVREWLATNSGGKADMYYEHIVDAPVPLASGEVPSNWNDIAKQVVREAYGLEPNNYYTRAYNIASLSISPGYAGVCCPAAGYNLKYTNLHTHVHEFGHYLGSPHARTYVRPATSYVWDESQQQYRAYLGDASRDFTPLPYGSEQVEYGSAFDPMGGGPATGHLRLRKKR